ncbi:ATP-binding protein [Brevibacterium album]|uniref:ATP-binding protein n=1 Tax=Brevibacterium album TaxID=417948 RepID=UPI0004284BC5|nr:ATP-binding protein [Brevibacterium album]
MTVFHAPQRLRRALRWFLGARFIDPAVRVWYLAMALLMVPPTAADGDGGVGEYIVVDLLPLVLTLVAPWLPGTSTCILTGLAVATLLGMPLPGEPSPELMGLVLLGTQLSTAALLIAFGRWRMAALAFAANVLLSAMFTMQTAELSVSTLMYSVAELFPDVALGTAFLYFERTFQRRKVEIAAAAAAHQRELDRQHDSIVRDTHDVISHTFSAARSLTAVQQRCKDPEQRREIEAELSVVLSAGEENFRQYILRMRREPDDRQIGFLTAFAQWCERLAVTMRTAQHPTTFHLEELPQTSNDILLSEATLLTQEICTNIIRHCPEGAPSTVHGYGAEGGLVLRVESSVQSGTQVTPDFGASLRRRTEAMGGTARFEIVENEEDTVLRTVLTLPVAGGLRENHPVG